MVKKVLCPVCNKPYDTVSTRHIPFCSERCQMIDLGKWLGEQYSLPVEGREDSVDDFDEGNFDQSEYEDASFE